MANCLIPRDKFIGSGRNSEGVNNLAARKQDFNSHASGAEFRHCADQIDLTDPIPELTGAITVQEALESAVSLLGSEVYTTIGNLDFPGDYTVDPGGTYPTFDDAFTAALAELSSSGGTILIKRGNYTMTGSYNLSGGLTIMGEGNAIINCKPAVNSPIFNVYGSSSETLAAATIQTLIGTKPLIIRDLTLWINRGKDVFSNYDAYMFNITNDANINLIIDNCICLSYIDSGGGGNYVERFISGTSTITNRMKISLINSFVDGFGYLINLIGRSTSDVVVKNNTIRTFNNFGITLSRSSLQLIGNRILSANFITAFSSYISLQDLSAWHRIIITNNYGGSDSSSLPGNAVNYNEGVLLNTSAISNINSVGASLIYQNNFWGKTSSTKVISFRSI